ncbi:hypothetical protein DL771_006733 [Monosporascus sp. 5C6A]|nr:hypothetical protein DL771_006733 [Monosporascus sp. 5C6A]
MAETSSSSAAGGNPEVIYSFATRAGVFGLSTSRPAATIEALFHKGDRSRILKGVHNDESIGRVMVEEMSKKEIEDTDAKAAAPGAARASPCPRIRSHRFRTGNGYATDVSGFGREAGVAEAESRSWLLCKGQDYAEDCNMGLLFLVEKNEKQFYERCGADFANDELKGKKTTYLVSCTRTGGAVQQQLLDSSVAVNAVLLQHACPLWQVGGT